MANMQIRKWCLPKEKYDFNMEDTRSSYEASRTNSNQTTGK